MDQGKLLVDELELADLAVRRGGLADDAGDRPVVALDEQDGGLGPLGELG